MRIQDISFPYRHSKPETSSPLSGSNPYDELIPDDDMINPPQQAPQAPNEEDENLDEEEENLDREIEPADSDSDHATPANSPPALSLIHI